MCEHTGLRYLDPFSYEKVEGGWRVPDDEREDWEARPYRWPSTSAPVKSVPARPLQELVVELEAWMYLDPPLETKFRALYDVDAQRATRLAAHVVTSAAGGRLRSPAAVLASLLRT